MGGTECVVSLWWSEKETGVVYYESIKSVVFLFYYESRKKELKTKLIYQWGSVTAQCDERLKNLRWGIYTPRIHWVTSFLLSYILRYVSCAEVDRVCRVALWNPMHLCTCVSEEGGDGEAVWSETPSLLSYTIRYVGCAEVGSVCRVALRKPMHLCTCVSEEGDDGGKLHAQNLDNILVTTTTLCIDLNIDGMSITPRSHTHQSRSQTFHLLPSSLCLGVPVPRTTPCMRVT